MKTLEPWIETFTGLHFEFLDPKDEQIHIRDIAHSLAFTCRYTGHSSRFYSVAEHSLFVSYLAADPLAGLLHDASEAYITDIASPIKPHLANYKELEDMIMGRIANKFGFKYPLDGDIKDCDATQLKTEAKYLLKSGGNPWAHLYPTRRAHGIKPICMAPEEAEKAFLERFYEVQNVSDSGNWPYDKGVFGVGFGSGSGGVCLSKNVPNYTGSLREPRTEKQLSHCGKDGDSERVGYVGLEESLVASRKAIEAGSRK